MKNLINKNIALEDSRNREVVAGCYDRGKSSGAFVLKRGAMLFDNLRAS